MKEDEFANECDRIHFTCKEADRISYLKKRLRLEENEVIKESGKICAQIRDGETRLLQFVGKIAQTCLQVVE